MKTTEEQDEQYLEEQRRAMKKYVDELVSRALPNGVEVRMATQKEQREAVEAAAERLQSTPVYAAPLPQDPDLRLVTTTTGADAEIWDEPDVELKPVPGTGGRVNRTVRHTNLPGGVLMDTRRFEKWVLESFIPLQDQTAALLGRCDRALETMNVVLSRIGRVEQQVRELKKIGRDSE